MTTRERKEANGVVGVGCRLFRVCVGEKKKFLMKICVDLSSFYRKVNPKGYRSLFSFPNTNNGKPSHN
jgi:hypothetical protein